VDEDGSIPTSEFGNVEMWTDKHCPKGGVHVRGQLVGAAASELGIPFAPALIGFEFRNRRQVPTLDGVVVAERYAQIVEQAAANMVEAKVAKQTAKQTAAILARWEKLVKGVLVYDRLREKYRRSDDEGDDDDKDEEENSPPRKRAKN